MLVQKGFESDPVAAWTKSQEKVPIQQLEYLHILTQNVKTN